jgi:hypothetical protein
MSRSRRPRESLLTRASTAEATSGERRTSENDCPKTRLIIGESWRQLLGVSRFRSSCYLPNEPKQPPQDRQHFAGGHRELDVYANWIVRAAQHLVSQYGVQIAAIIPETTERWDAEEASRRAELARRGEVYSSSGSTAPVVGALAGLIIYTVASLPFRQSAN